MTALQQPSPPSQSKTGTTDMPAALPDQLMNAVKKAKDCGLVVTAAEAVRDGKKTTVKLSFGDRTRPEKFDDLGWDK